MDTVLGLPGSWWPWLAAFFYLVGAGVNLYVAVVGVHPRRAWIRWLTGLFGGVIGGFWLWLALDPSLDRGEWSEALAPWSTLAGVFGVGCLGALQDIVDRTEAKRITDRR